MGRSLRRAKKFRPKVRVGVPNRRNRNKLLKSRTPSYKTSTLEAAHLDKFGYKEKQWNENLTYFANYHNMNFVSDANSAVKEKANQEQNTNNKQQQLKVVQDDQVQIACQDSSLSRKTLPMKITPRQRRWIAKLIEVHGEDVFAMTRDTKLNCFLKSEGYLKKRIKSYYHWKESDGVDFWAPQNCLWKP
eukprot:TRINITY_DN11565_c0_g1_i2.p2 TRINITY_DN11565_c0_g1~~TRINITY_DN11565_c0_g1_i2.p2  ORF type:complete len:189 (-),score=20.04 TRINITY_DN11565_c0_g1_i2:414-980(-)